MTDRAPSLRHPRAFTRAFTLVELLVVIGIIAMLIGILMPALSAARAQANMLKCAANLRALGQVAQAYAHDNRGYIPRDYSRGRILEGYIFWAEVFARYLDRSFEPLPAGLADRDQQLALRFARIQSYQCPVFPNDAQTVDFIINAWNKYRPGEVSVAFKITKLKRSAEVVLLTEVNRNHSTTNLEYHDVWNPVHLPGSSSSRILDDARHRNNINVCYLDGHVASRPYKSLKEKDFRADVQ